MKAIDRIVAVQTKQASLTLVAVDVDAHVKRTVAARNLLRQRQLFLALFGGGVGLVLLLLSCVIPWTWYWVIATTGGPEAVGHLLVELVMNKRRSGKSSSSRKDGKSNLEPLSTSKRSGVEVNSSSQESGPIAFSLRLPRRKNTGKPWRQDLSKIAEESRLSSSVQVTKVDV